jgi:hypothetical protein
MQFMRTKDSLLANRDDPRVTNAFCEAGDTDVLANEPVNVVHIFWGLRGQARISS